MKIDNTMILIGLGIIFFFGVILPYIGGVDSLVKLISDNLLFIIAIAGIAYFMRGQIRKDVQIWNGPSGWELLKKAIATCDEFKYNKITFLGVPKGKNNVQFIHDKKHQIYHYYMTLQHDDNIKTYFVISYDPWKPGSWNPRVKSFIPMSGVNLVKMAKQGSNPGILMPPDPEPEPEQEEEKKS